MAIAFVQKNSRLGVSGDNGQDTTVQFSTANVTTGNLIVVMANWSGNQGLNATNPMTDDKGNTYTYTQSLDTTDQINVAIGYAKITVGGGTKPIVKVRYAGTTAASFQSIYIYEFSGADNVLDQSPVMATGSGTSMAAGSITIANANDILLATCIPNFSVSSGPASFTTDIDGNGVGYAYRIVTSTGTYSATFTQSSAGVWNALHLALKAASSGTNQQGTVTSAMGRSMTNTARNSARATVTI